MFVTKKTLRTEVEALRYRIALSEDRCQRVLDQLNETEEQLRALIRRLNSEQMQVTKDTRKSLALLFKHMDLTIEDGPRLETLKKGSVHGPRIL